MKHIQLYSVKGIGYILSYSLSNNTNIKILEQFSKISMVYVNVNKNLIHLLVVENVIKINRWKQDRFPQEYKFLFDIKICLN